MVQLNRRTTSFSQAGGVRSVPWHSVLASILQRGTTRKIPSKSLPHALPLKHNRKRTNQQKREAQTDSRTTLETTPNSSSHTVQSTVIPIRLTSIYYYHRATRLWALACYSLLLDCFLITSWTLPFLSDAGRQNLLCLLLLVTFLSPILMNHERLLHWRELAFQRKEELIRKAQQHSLLLGAVLLIVTLLKTAGSLFGFSGGAVLIAIPVLGYALYHGRKEWRQARAARERRERFRSYWVEDINAQIFQVSLIPILAARFIGLGGVVWSLESPNPYVLSAGWSLLGILFLGSARPTRNHFMYLCRTCARPTSRALQSIGVCPNCKPSSFFANGIDGVKTTQ